MLEEFVIRQLSKSHHQEENLVTLDPFLNSLGGYTPLLTLTLDAKPLTGKFESTLFLPPQMYSLPYYLER